MHLIDGLMQHPTASIFQILDSSSETSSEWAVEPVDEAILADSEGHYIVKAKNVLPDGTIVDCYIDVSLPERVSDFAYFREGGSLRTGYRHEFRGELVCMVPIDCFGAYELFYSKTAPQIGIEALRAGLSVGERKTVFVEDLGYIFRDERRFKEAAEMFQLAANEGPSSHFIYEELALCYDETGNKVLANKYHEMYVKPPIG